jgi:hypothetical protein
VISLISTAAIAIAAVSAPSTATIQAAPPPTLSTTTLAAASSQRHRNDDQAVGVESSSATSVDNEAIQRQLQIRVLLPPLSGDGGS